MLKRRGLVVVLALIPAALATVGVVLYSRGVDEQPLYGGPMVPVVVSKVDILAGTDLNELIKDDQFRIIRIPEEAVVVDRPVTLFDQLRGRAQQPGYPGRRADPGRPIKGSNEMTRDEIEHQG